MPEGYPIGKEKLSEDELVLLMEAFMNAVLMLPGNKMGVLRKKAGLQKLNLLKRLNLSMRLRLGGLLPLIGMPAPDLGMDEEMGSLLDFLLSLKENETADLFLRIREEMGKRPDFDPELMLANHAKALIRELTDS